jgi:hypothetical protein
MKQIKAFCLFVFALALTFAFSSCAHFHDDPTKSVWSGGLLIIFWLPFLGSLVFVYYAYKARESGYKQRKGEFSKWEDATGKLPYLKIPQTWFAIALQVIAWVICYIVNQSA